ncbi:MAG: hypothetical protein ABW187_04500, partial [Dokdonella sp.]
GKPVAQDRVEIRHGGERRKPLRQAIGCRCIRRSCLSKFAPLLRGDRRARTTVLRGDPVATSTEGGSPSIGDSVPSAIHFSKTQCMRVVRRSPASPDPVIA